jgi:hypothetical protein
MSTITTAIPVATNAICNNIASLVKIEFSADQNLERLTNGMLIPEASS